MSLLAIETATRQLGVAVINGPSTPPHPATGCGVARDSAPRAMPVGLHEQVLASYELLAEHPHAAELPGAVRRVLAAARVTLDELEAIVVDIGPGSFTGLRIGLAFAKALAFPNKTPLVGVPSLDVLAANVPFAARCVVPMLDAKQKNVYSSLYRLDGGRPVRQTDHLLGPVDEVLALVNPALKGGVKEPAVFLGDGAALYRDRIVQRCPDAQFAAPELWLPRAATLARLGQERFLQGHRDDPARLVPLYLYPKDCQVRGPDRPTSVLQTSVGREP